MSASLYADKVGAEICSPYFDASGVLHVLSQATGDVLAVGPSSEVTVAFNAGGQPSGAALSPGSGALYLADLAHSAVLSVDDLPSGKQSVVVRVYEDKAFKGPNSLAFDNADNLYFTDSGALGETGLHAPRGSLYYISNGIGGQMLRPLALECLAHPCGVAVSPDGRAVYVAEMMLNRVLRFVQRPTGVFHCSVFAQLSGGVGPSALACDSSGALYIGHYELAETGARGRITVLGADGRQLSEISVPAPEITGLCLTPDQRALVITEASSGSVYSVNI